MRRPLFSFLSVLLVVAFIANFCWAQTATAGATVTVPPLIKVSGTLANAQGTVGVTFALYAEQTGGAPLWLETQNVTPDANGRYTIYLGANHANGVPLSLFASGEAQWLGVQPEGQPEQARAQLVSVPYALTAGDAQTLGGQPLSAFVLASSANATTTTASSSTTASAGSGGIVALATPQAGGTAVTTTAGTTNYLAKFTSTAGDIENSMVYDTGTAVGIGTTAPAAALHVVSSSAAATTPAAGFVDTYSSGANGLTAVSLVTRAARGTPTIPAAVTTGDVIGGFTGRGYYMTSPTTGAFSGGRGSLIIRANEPWTPTAQSTYIQFNTAPLGQAFQTERMRIDNAGNVGINTTNPGGAPVLPLAAPVVLEVNGNVKMTAGSGGGHDLPGRLDADDGVYRCEWRGDEFQRPHRSGDAGQRRLYVLADQRDAPDQPGRHGGDGAELRGPDEPAVDRREQDLHGANGNQRERDGANGIWKLVRDQHHWRGSTVCTLNQTAALRQPPYMEFPTAPPASTLAWMVSQTAVPDTGFTDRLTILPVATTGSTVSQKAPRGRV